MTQLTKKYRRTFEDLEEVASKFWPAELSELEAKLSVIPLLLETQDQFISVISVETPDLGRLFKIVEASSLSANLFLKHLVILADFGGEPLQRVSREFEMLFPDSARLEDLTMTYGPNLFYSSVELRKLCCQVRKVEPLRRKLSQLDAWICGLRREQSVTRDQLKRIEWDEAFGLVKVNPLADWSGEQVWKHIRDNEVPYNKLHDKGYPSIGCSPCTRAVKEGGDIRSGRWWWESPEHKECGLHIHP